MLLFIEVEPDDFAGFHAIVTDEEDDGHVMHITNSFLSPLDALEVAQRWIKNTYPAARPLSA